ncbi:MAG: N-acetylglucosamine-6-phosphate deacetylase [Treponema sp.]|nr:N-acetylglucosamine-6-phosphate deacetylase [Spirochaetia bacterium]MDD7769075.1 N-acetylglucosamine-6-phosphate deacetylase [Treponema sp.]MDY3132076.1 N-acetylglucosamine-6-phosphate deacetylase [Treponema sp.]
MIRCIHNGIVINGMSKSDTKGAVLIENGIIADVFTEARFEQKTFGPDVEVIDAKGNYILPGLIDTHIHGFKGHGTDECTTEGILQMSKDLAQYGVTAFNPTMYPAPLEEMEETCKKIVAAMGKEEGAHIMGIHLEGPFISPDKLGVQKPDTVQKPNIQVMERLIKASDGHIVNMTVAPELSGMRELALYCIDKGIVLQAGHTNAKYENMLEGIQVGILHSTHFFNAMSQLHHRNPGAVGAVLIHPEMSCEIIADGVHVHPSLFKLLRADKSSDQIVLVTDALTPTVQKGEHLFANGEEVEFVDGCFHRKEDGVIAGSALTLKKGVKNMVDFGFSVADAVKFATANPARIMHYSKKGILAPSYDGDVVVMDKKFSVKLVVLKNETIVKNKLEEK